MPDEDRRCSWCGSGLVTKSERGYRCLRCGTETEEDDR